MPSRKATLRKAETSSPDVAVILPLPHYDHLDGVRGIAAFYVVLHHAWLLSANRFPISAETGWVGLCTNWLLYGHLSVDVFIVLSGFCLILPIARRGNLDGGSLDFYRRRARRILPPYFAALVVSTLLYLSHNPSDMHLWKNVGIHLLLLQDIFNRYALFNPPIWTIAVEWHIYFAFPILVAALLRFPTKYRYAAILLGTAVVGYGIVRLYLAIASDAKITDLGHVCPWYLFLFGMGVTAGWLSERESYSPKVWQIACGILLLLLGSALAIFPWRSDESDLSRAYPLVDAFAGAFTASLLIVLRGTGHLTRFFALRIFAKAGFFAYSLYLMHFPILLLVQAIVNNKLPDADRLIRFLPLLIVGVPLSVALSYLFHIVAERPFLHRRQPSVV